MKFVLPAQSADLNKELKNFLFYIYSGKDPQYCSIFFPDPSICLSQIHELCKAIKKRIKKNNDADWHSLSAKVDVLYNNIERHIRDFDTLSKTEKANTVDFCKIGKRCLESITYKFIHDSRYNDSSQQLMTAFLLEDQIALCMGGVLTIVQDYSLKFTHDITAEITNACTNGIKAASAIFIERFDLLHFTNNNEGKAIRIPESLKETHEVHYINYLFNCIAYKFNFLNPITDNYTKLFPVGGWHTLFIETLNENDLLAFYLEDTLTSLPALSNHFDLNLYTHCCTLLDAIGSDTNFYLYEDIDGKIQLKKNHRLALQATVIKRLIDSKLLQYSAHDFKYELCIEKTTYELYLCGNPGQYWIERIDSFNDHTFISFNDRIPSELLKALGNSHDKTLKELVLRAAAVHNNIPLLDILCESGIDINCQDNEGNTPLMLAVIYCSLEFIKIIINDIKLDINKQNNTKTSALMLAAKGFDREDVITLLLQNPNIDTELKNAQHKTALHLAVSNENIAVTTALVFDKRVNINAIDSSGRNCLHIAALYNRLGIANILLRHVDLDLNQLSNDGLTVLHATIMYGTLGFTNLLLRQKNIDINLIAKSKTPLMFAIENFRNEASKLLISDDRIQLEICDDTKKTARDIAKIVGNHYILQLIPEQPKTKNLIITYIIPNEATSEEASVQSQPSPKRRRRPACIIM